jgi:hypothetical protein
MPLAVTFARSNCARCTAKSSSSASVLAALRFAIAEMNKAPVSHPSRAIPPIVPGSEVGRNQEWADREAGGLYARPMCRVIFDL